MELPVAYQGGQFFWAVLVGLLYGLAYDLLRGLGKNLPIVTHGLDFIYCLILLLGNMLLTLYVGRGSYRIFFPMAQALGAWLWFRCPGRPMLWLSQKFWALLLYPAVIFWKFFRKIIKKSKFFSKMIFSNREKSVKIKGQQFRRRESRCKRQKHHL